MPATLRAQRLTQGNLLRRVEAVFQKAVELHGRSGKIELFLFAQDAPLVQLWPGCVLMLSDSLTGELDDVELAGIMTHELGHSYFEDEMVAAQRRQDTRAMRLVELKCDAVAMVSLKLMGHNPGLYVRALNRLQAINKRQSRSRGFLQSHPELVTRARFAERLIKLLH